VRAELYLRRTVLISEFDSRFVRGNKKGSR
jgi:hypothetical protein